MHDEAHGRGDDDEGEAASDVRPLDDPAPSSTTALVPLSPPPPLSLDSTHEAIETSYPPSTVPNLPIEPPKLMEESASVSFDDGAPFVTRCTSLPLDPNPPETSAIHPPETINHHTSAVVAEDGRESDGQSHPHPVKIDEGPIDEVEEGEESGGPAFINPHHHNPVLPDKIYYEEEGEEEEEEREGRREEGREGSTHSGSSLPLCSRSRSMCSGLVGWLQMCSA